MATTASFEKAFRALTGNDPFPWQRALYDRFMSDRADNIPATCNLPTGLGKTSVVAIWLIALAHGNELPRRLVYVVNRRTVVDQTTNEVERLRNRLKDPKEHAVKPGHIPILEAIAAQLATRCAVESDFPLAISTLRGQFADNREWSADPSRPAVICGTVDMIGSRLLFSGYGVGFRGKPLHAGFLGQDAMLVHDEAHLEPAFQKLIDSIQREQDRCKEFAKFHVMQLTATTRSDDGQETTTAFTLQKEDRAHPIVKLRIEAAKHLQLHQAKDDARIAEEIADLALERRWVKDEKGESIKDENGNLREANAAVVIFVRTLDDVKKVCDKLTNKKDGVPGVHVQTLTGTMRGLERDRMADPRRRDSSRVFARFLKPPKPDAPENEQWQTEPMRGTVYLVCTSAGEVGIDISADHMVCDLSTFESMAQRFGRVNRYGDRTDARIDVVYPASFGKIDKKTGELKADDIDKRRQKTLNLLKKLPAIDDNQYDASPKALGDLRQCSDLPCRIEDAFTPEPTILPTSDILFDAWSMTSIRDHMPGRPFVEPYLHGIRDYEPPETHVAWREEVGMITGDLLNEYLPEDLLEEYPLRPHELLGDRTDRVWKELVKLAGQFPDTPTWVIDESGKVTPIPLDEIAEEDGKERIERKTVLLPDNVGGVTCQGLLDGSYPPPSKGEESSTLINNDVADALMNKHEKPIRVRLWKDDDDPDFERAAGMRRMLSIEFPPPDNDEDAVRQSWHWFELPLPKDNSKNATKPVLLDAHVSDVVNRARAIVANLELDDWIKNAIILAAMLHDLGKRRELWQRSIGRPIRFAEIWFGKSGRRWKPRDISDYRHEFGSLVDLQSVSEFQSLDDDSKDLVQHLIATHHGQGRPHFAVEQIIDSHFTTPECEAIAIEVPRRFSRLQRKFGRWGLAYLESLLRAADWSASAEPSKFFTEEGK